jgi:hypothetical protein
MGNRWRGMAMGLATVAGLAKRGFFIPYRYAAGVRTPGGKRAYPALEPILAAGERGFLKVLGSIDAFAPALQAIGRENPPQPRWTQDWFPGLDAAAAYTLTRTLKPGRIVEIGSGHSTRFMARAVADGGLATRFTAIDPAPRAGIEGLGINMVRSTLQEAGTRIFEGLGTGDFVAIDSSHILMPGTDVDLLLNGILPALPTGAVIHIHDIFLPDGYPPSWEWRGYNEQQAVAALLTGGGFELVFASHFVRTRMAERVAATVMARLPLSGGAFESSLWLRKKG